MHRDAEALREYERVLQLKPDHPLALNNMAAIRLDSVDASLRDPAKALPLAKRACEATGQREPNLLRTLARAQAASGDLPAAAATAQTALDLAKAANNAALIESLQRLVDLCRAGSAQGSDSTRR